MSTVSGPISSAGDSLRQPAGKMSDNWLIEKSQECIASGRIHEARAWILTAKSLYPKQFRVQHEVLQLQISSGQLGDAAALLYSLLRDFPDEQRLWDLVEKMVCAVERRRQGAPSMESDCGTLTSVFAEMNESQQKKLIMMFADQVKADTQRYCRVLMLSMRLYPDTVRTCAMPAVESIATQLQDAAKSPSRNEAWHFLVADLLPTILSSKQVYLQTSTSDTSASSGSLGVSLVTASRWLDLTIEFYLDMALGDGSSESSSAASVLLSPTRTRRFSLDTPSASEMQDTQPWKSAWNLVSMMAEVCDWKGVQDSGVFDKGLPLLERARKLQTLATNLLGIPLSDSLSPVSVNKLHFPASVPRETMLSIFYPSLLTLLEACWSYSQVSPFPGLSLGNMILLDLPQSRPAKDLAAEPEAKRRKGLENVGEKSVLLTMHPSLSSSCNIIVHQFQAALQTWQLLNSAASLKGEYQRVMTMWNSSQWTWLAGFQRDVMLYNGDVEGLSKSSSTSDAVGSASTAAGIQHAFAMFAAGHLEEACRQALDMFHRLEENTDPSTCLSAHPVTQFSSTTSSSSSPVRELQLTPCSQPALLPLLVRMLVLFYETMDISQSTSDETIGRILVLCQYGWPQFEPLFAKVAELMMEKGSFSFPKFFEYVVNVDVLEEISYLHNSGCKLVLSSGNSNSAKRTVTRGVKKGAKEEIKSAIERQVMTVDSSQALLDKRLISFLRGEQLP